MTDRAAVPSEMQVGILLVDDNPDVLHLLHEMFEAAGYRCYSAGNGAQALWMAIRDQPDIIVMDERMPGMGGLDVCRCLKRSPATASIPVIMLSGAHSPEDRVAGFAAGAVDFIGKPFAHSEVLARVKTHADMAAVRKEIMRRRRDGSRAWQSRPNASEAGKDILIAEDSPESLRLLATILEKNGFVVREATNGELALWSATKHPPAMILLDIRMPGMNGIDVCHALKANPETLNIPVIFVSAFGDEDVKQEGFAAGAVDFITKPFVEDELLARINVHRRLSDSVYGKDPAGNEERAPAGNLVTTEIEEAFSYSDCAILFADDREHVVFANPSFLRMSGCDRKDVVGIDLRRAFPQQNLPVWAKALQDSACCSGEALLPTRNGGSQFCMSALSKVADSDGNAFTIIAFEDVSAAIARQTPIDAHLMGRFSIAASEASALDLKATEVAGYGELAMLVQPIFSFSPPGMAGAEAMLRCKHPTPDMLDPEQFLQATEETGEIVSIGRWLVNSVCQQIAASHGVCRHDGFTVAFNIGSLQFWQDGLPGVIEGAILTSGVSPERLRIVVAADTVLEDLTQGVAVLNRLKRLGVSLALDRYGPNALSPDLLKRLPIDGLKIEPAFWLSNDATTRDAVRGVTDLAHQLGLTVLAKGIEEPWQLTLAESYRCDFGQGGLLGTPRPPAEFLREWLHEGA